MRKLLATKIGLILLVVLNIVIVSGVVYAATTFWSGSGTATITTAPVSMSLYSDSGATVLVPSGTALSFGPVAQGQQATKQLWAKNNGTGTVTLDAVAPVTVSVGGSPAGTITGAWSAATLAPGGTVSVTLTLMANSGATPGDAATTTDIVLAAH
jgi:hypothetical protein